MMKCIRMLTFLPLEQIDEMSAWKDARLNEAKDILAYELTKMVHGEEEAQKAREAARALFSTGGDSAHIPTFTVEEKDFKDGRIGIIDLLTLTGLCTSKGDARRNIEQGGVEAAGERVKDITLSFSREELQGTGIMLKRGKKKFFRITC